MDALHVFISQLYPTYKQRRNDFPRDRENHDERLGYYIRYISNFFCCRKRKCDTCDAQHTKDESKQSFHNFVISKITCYTIKIILQNK